MDDKTIKIKCRGADVCTIDTLSQFQGNLKSLSEVNYAKLHDLILTKGFDSPIQIWIDPEGKKQILDGTQRLRVLLKLKEEGYTIPGIPVDYIEADNKKDARERLLTKVSVYGRVDEEGLYEFNNEPGFEIEASFAELLDFPEIDLSKDDIQVKQKKEPEGEQIITCPSCAHKFTLEEAKLAE